VIAAYQYGLLLPLAPCGSTESVQPMAVVALNGNRTGGDAVVLRGQDGIEYDALVRPIWGNTGIYYWLTPR
jgi:hypothetical protein